MKTALKIAYGTFAVIVAIGIIGYMNADHSDDPDIYDITMESTYQKVINDAIQQYEIVKRTGNEIESSVQAGIVAAAYLQAKDEINYNKWNAIQKQHDKAAGL